MLSACSKRNLTYFSDLDNRSVYSEQVSALPEEPVIQPGDLLNISVSTMNPEANVLFNRGEISRVGSDGGGASSPVNTNEGYLVDRNGNINFPVLGIVKISGSTKSEVHARLTTLLKEYLKDPIVNIRYQNYRITIVGEVKNPSTLLVPAEQITIIEALGMAGDLTVFGKRDNILIIRQSEGVRTMARLNLNNKEMLNSPYFYLQPNDVIYVEPVKAKGSQASMGRQNLSLALSLVSIAVLIYTRVF